MTVTPVVHPKPQVLYIDGVPMAQTKAVLRRDSVGTAELGRNGDFMWDIMGRLSSTW